MVSSSLIEAANSLDVTLSPLAQIQFRKNVTDFKL